MYIQSAISTETELPCHQLMNFDELKKLEEQEAELAEKRALDRKNGKLDTSKKRRIFQNLIDSRVFVNPREDRLKKKD